MVQEDTDMVQIRETFQTREAAEQFITRYLQDYHPAGYGTRFKEPVQEGGHWSVSGYRYSSCD